MLWRTGKKNVTYLIPYQIAPTVSGKGVEIRVGIAENEVGKRLLVYSGSMIIDPTSTRVNVIKSHDANTTYVVISEDELTSKDAITFVPQPDFYSMLDEDERNLIGKALLESNDNLTA